jgi:hypothetical protein
MANKVTNFGTVKNLREWLEDQFNKGKHLYCNNKKCTDVDLIWDGTNYHIAYVEADNPTEGIYIQPFTYTDERVWSVK